MPVSRKLIPFTLTCAIIALITSVATNILFNLPWIKEMRLNQLRDANIASQTAAATERIKKNLARGCVQDARVALSMETWALERFGGVRKFMPEYDELMVSTDQALAAVADTVQAASERREKYGCQLG